MAPNREICTFFYEDKGQGDYRCQLRGTSRKQQVGSGYSNLLSHLTSTHHDFEETYRASWVVERNMPISEVDDPLTRSMASWKPVSSKTLKLDMQTCAPNVGGVIKKELGEIFGVMWDGWTHGTVHYVGIYGVTFVNGKHRERLTVAVAFGGR
ncbi:hypothetical protein PF006_g28656 [Phytophthora fragariae]|uniref:BED-type domain-containing protein n=2 Tax=Phytophthora fragariae TaxID=53985 RepID=A0A6A3DIL7_9STRA|nr:hypothetical protein PF003_g33374 [Phytophthora fragariae]KAE8921682.1 hypothetical protein PF009_g28043 [Phytophthora fragariae]KAE9073800.1 hypothetical protein PF006_g28656 [Phytophthora fragariae]KAE9171344.1 hypothetical protein PF004_g27598 [Phytophthora fragariae]